MSDKSQRTREDSGLHSYTKSQQRERGRKEAEGEGATGVPPVRAVESSETVMGVMKFRLAWSMRGL